MKVKDKMNKNIIAVDKKINIYEIASIMKEKDIGFILVCDGKKGKGILTDRDICTKILANKDLENIESYLSTNLVTIDKEESLEKALKVMEKNKIKRLLVTDKNKIVGVLSLSDILEKINEYELLNTIKTIFKKETNQKEKTAQIDSFYL